MRLPDYIKTIDHRVRAHIPPAPWTSCINAAGDTYVLTGPHGVEIARIPLNTPEALLIANFLSHAREDVTILLHELTRQAWRIKQLEDASSDIATELN